LYIHAKYRTSQKSGYPLGERPFDTYFDAGLREFGAKKRAGNLPALSEPPAAKAAFIL
jgi:hypothetical protein